MRITVHNRGPDAATIDLLPQLWFRNTWSWNDGARPGLSLADGAIVAHHESLGEYRLHVEGKPAFLFTENETNAARVFGAQGAAGPFKDAFHEYLIGGRAEAISQAPKGTKVAVHERARDRAGRSRADAPAAGASAALTSRSTDFDAVLEQRQAEADAFYAVLQTGLTRCRRPQHPAPGVRRHDLGQAALPLRRVLVARRRSRPAAAAARAQARAQRRLAPSEQRRHHLDAGQVGVSLVRGLGHRVPLHPARPDRRRVRQAPAHPVDACLVPAPERPDSRPTNGRSATSTRRSTPGRRIACFRSIASSAAGAAISPSSSASTTS